MLNRDFCLPSNNTIHLHLHSILRFTSTRALLLLSLCLKGPSSMYLHGFLPRNFQFITQMSPLQEGLPPALNLKLQKEQTELFKITSAKHCHYCPPVEVHLTNIPFLFLYLAYSLCLPIRIICSTRSRVCVCWLLYS